MKKLNIEVRINGASHIATVEPRLTLLDFIRDVAGLNGTHTGCEHGICGACSILLDGIPIRACLMLAVQADGRRITTVEGLSNSDGTSGILQDAFIEAHGMQCGYCTPGMIMAGVGILDQNSNPSESEIRHSLEGNICRCTGYQNIVKAVQTASQAMEGGA